MKKNHSTNTLSQLSTSATKIPEIGQPKGIEFKNFFKKLKKETLPNIYKIDELNAMKPSLDYFKNFGKYSCHNIFVHNGKKKIILINALIWPYNNHPFKEQIEKEILNEILEEEAHEKSLQENCQKRLEEIRNKILMFTVEKNTLESIQKNFEESQKENSEEDIKKIYSKLITDTKQKVLKLEEQINEQLKNEKELEGELKRSVDVSQKKRSEESKKTPTERVRERWLKKANIGYMTLEEKKNETKEIEEYNLFFQLYDTKFSDKEAAEKIHRFIPPLTIGEENSRLNTLFNDAFIKMRDGNDCEELLTIFLGNHPRKYPNIVIIKQPKSNDPDHINAFNFMKSSLKFALRDKDEEFEIKFEDDEEMKVIKNSPKSESNDDNQKSSSSNTADIQDNLPKKKEKKNKKIRKNSNTDVDKNRKSMDSQNTQDTNSGNTQASVYPSSKSTDSSISPNGSCSNLNNIDQDNDRNKKSETNTPLGNNNSASEQEKSANQTVEVSMDKANVLIKQVKTTFNSNLFFGFKTQDSAIKDLRANLEEYDACLNGYKKYYKVCYYINQARIELRNKENAAYKKLTKFLVESLDVKKIKTQGRKELETQDSEINEKIQKLQEQYNQNEQYKKDHPETTPSVALPQSVNTDANNNNNNTPKEKNDIKQETRLTYRASDVSINQTKNKISVAKIIEKAIKISQSKKIKDAALIKAVDELITNLEIQKNVVNEDDKFYKTCKYINEFRKASGKDYDKAKHASELKIELRNLLVDCLKNQEFGTHSAAIKAAVVNYQVSGLTSREEYTATIRSLENYNFIDEVMTQLEKDYAEKYPDDSSETEESDVSGPTV